MKSYKYIKRHISNFVERASRTFPVVVLTGARQVGKTTLFENLINDGRKFVSLDNPTIRNSAINDPERFLQIYSPPIAIDEVQYAPELFPYIKILVDKRKKNGDFWLTGSQSFTMMHNVTESLAGRAAIIPITNLSEREINGQNIIDFNFDVDLLKKSKIRETNVKNVFSSIYRGFFPKIIAERNIDLSLYYESYIDTYITRDISNLKDIGNKNTFLKFIEVVACRTATNLNYQTLANEVDITAPTAKAWLSLLISSGLVILVEPYTSNALKRIVKSPRIYFTDTGLLSHLMGWSSSEVLEKSNMSGSIFETYVVNEIYKTFINNGKKPPLYFYRNNSKEEIDLIVELDGIIHPVGIKKSSNPKNPLKNFSSIKGNIGIGYVICTCSDITPISKKDYLVPVGMI